MANFKIHVLMEVIMISSMLVRGGSCRWQHIIAICLHSLSKLQAALCVSSYYLLSASQGGHALMQPNSQGQTCGKVWAAR